MNTNKKNNLICIYISPSELKCVTIATFRVYFEKYIEGLDVHWISDLESDVNLCRLIYRFIFGDNQHSRLYHIVRQLFFNNIHEGSERVSHVRITQPEDIPHNTGFQAGNSSWAFSYTVYASQFHKGPVPFMNLLFSDHALLISGFV